MFNKQINQRYSNDINQQICDPYTCMISPPRSLTSVSLYHTFPSQQNHVVKTFFLYVIKDKCPPSHDRWDWHSICTSVTLQTTQLQCFINPRYFLGVANGNMVCLVGMTSLPLLVNVKTTPSSFLQFCKQLFTTEHLLEFVKVVIRYKKLNLKWSTGVNCDVTTWMCIRTFCFSNGPSNGL